MKNLLIIAALFLVSCQKESVKVSSSSLESNQVLVSSVTFSNSVPVNVVLSAGLNTIKEGSFDVSESCRLSKFICNVSGTISASKFKFYIDGGEYICTTTLEAGVLTIVPNRSLIVGSGTHSYIIQAKVLSGSFQVILTDALFFKNSFTVAVSGLPDAGNYLTVN